MKAIKNVALFTAMFAAFSGAHAADFYGNIDAGMTYSKVNGVATTVVDSGQAAASYLGVKSTEDLGNGLKAIMTLEAAVNLDDGTTTASNRLFNREASIGLTNGAQSFKMGRLESLNRTALRQYDVFGDAPWSMARIVIDATGNYVSNTAAYNYAAKGVTVGVQHSFGEKINGGLTAGSANAVHAGYAFGNAAASITRTSTDGGTSNTMFGASYDFGVAKTSMTYQDDKHSTMDHSVTFGVNAPIHGNIEMLASVAEATMVKGASTHAYAIGAKYSMSKRTSLYAAVNHTNVAGIEGRQLSVGMNHKL